MPSYVQVESFALEPQDVAGVLQRKFQSSATGKAQGRMPVWRCFLGSHWGDAEAALTRPGTAPTFAIAVPSLSSARLLSPAVSKLPGKEEKDHEIMLQARDGWLKRLCLMDVLVGFSNEDWHQTCFARW